MAEKVARVGVRKAPGYLYFVDKNGDISRAKMSRGAAKRRKKKKKKKKKVARKKKKKKKKRKVKRKRRR